MIRIGKKIIQEAGRYVTKDVEDDYLPDVINYQDYLSEQKFFDKLKFTNGTHGASQLQTVNIPKPTLILRPGHILRLADRIYYQILVQKIAKKIHKVLPSKKVVFGYRISLSNTFFEKVFDWKIFNEKTYTNFLKKPDGYLLKTDISAYFEHIQRKKLGQMLKTLGADKDVVDSLESLLYSWFPHDVGIPQPYDASSFLGNVYLYEVDEAMIAEGFNYYRYMDDIRVFGDSQVEISKALRMLTELLRPLNLHLAAGKTKILTRKEYLPGREIEDEIDHISYGIYRKKPVIISEKKLIKLWKNRVYKNGKIVEKTAFNFCLKRFASLDSPYLLKVILKNSFFDPSFSKEVYEYLKKYATRKLVQSEIIRVVNESPHEYQKIFLLKTLLEAKKTWVPISSIDRKKIYDTQNNIVIGHFIMVAMKFGNQGVRATIKNDISTLFSNDERVVRYYLISLQFVPNSRAQAKVLLAASSNLIYTYLYLDKKKLIT